MVSKSDFAPEDWQTLVTAAPLVGLGVSAASPSGPFGVLKEMFSVGMALSEALRDSSGQNPLVKAVAEDMRARGTKPAPPKDLKSPDAVQRAVLEYMGRVSDVLAKKAPAEAEGFKRWLVDVAKRVAAAANEGGFLGLGGQRVSPEEEAAIKAIAEKLGVAV